MIKLSSLTTPVILKFGNNLPLEEIAEVLNEQFMRYGGWNDQCSKFLSENPITLFLYDRFEYVIGNAFGSHDYKIALNPLMILCHHPKCLKKNKAPTKLKYMFDLTNYLNHLKDHWDVIGLAMQTRFEIVHKNNFVSKEQLDEKSASPVSLFVDVSDSLFSDATVKTMERFGIDRGYGMLYICYWKDKLVKSDLITPTSLSFQEDDALIYLAMHYPNPVRDWSKWQTLYYYSLKMLSSVSSIGVNLFRGITNYQRLSLNNETSEVGSFLAQVNHPGPSITSLENAFPDVCYENETYHENELLFHLNLLEKSEESIKLDFGNVKRYPVTLGIDEQEINQGTFIKDNHLYGLLHKLSIQDLKSIGLENLSKHIAENNPYLSSVREYRLTDFKGVMCSNVFTSFDAGALSSDACLDPLGKVVQFSKSCINCLKKNVSCKYEKLNKPCSNCVDQMCVSMVVFHVLWDMASYHKKISNSVQKIDNLSTNTEYMSSSLYTIGFGGLHLGKNFINSSRNHVLSSRGERFGLNILRSMKNETDEASKILHSIKNAVFVGKDRQSDYLAYMTCSTPVQEALQLKKTYNLIRIPEKVLHYVENVKSHKKMINPRHICSNKNGDTFILDVGASCVCIIDQSIVAKMFVVGKHNEEKYNTKQEVVLAKDLRLSDDLTDMMMLDDNLMIADKGRGEVVIVNSCHLAKDISSKSKISILEIDHVLSLAFCNDMLLVLKEGGQVQAISYKDKKNQQTRRYALYLELQIIKCIKLKHEVQNLFQIHSTEGWFGTLSTENKIYFIKTNRENREVQEFNVSLCSSSTPYCNHKTIYTTDGKSILSHSLQLNDKISIGTSQEVSTKTSPIAFTFAGKVLTVVGRMNLTLSIEEVGPLDFGLELCKAINEFYNAITYIPPHGNQLLRKISLVDSVFMAQPLVDVLSEMQLSREATYTSRKSFMGPNGMPFSATIQCLSDTVNSWRYLITRLNYIEENHLHLDKDDESKDDASNDDKSKIVSAIYPHTITNEAIVEHTFGFSMKKGQGHMQTKEEYTHSKRKHAFDFQMRMVKSPFNQHTKTKLRDKGYQHLHPSFRSNVEMKDLVDICLRKKKKKDNMQVDPVNEEDEKVLRCAFLLTKSVPRRTNRAKWKEASGFSPNLMCEKSESGSLLKGDLVFFKSADESLLYMIIVDNVLLTDINTRVNVKPVVDGERNFSISVDKLLHDKGLVVVVPSYLYSVIEGIIEFTDIAQELFQEIMDRDAVTFYSDDDWALLQTQSNIIDNPVEEPMSSGSELSGLSKRKRKTQIADSESGESDSELAPLLYSCAKKSRNRISDSEDEVSFHISSLDCKNKNSVKKEDYVIVKYEATAFVGRVIKIEENDFQVSALHRCGINSFKWPLPTHEDICWYKEVLAKVKAPQPLNNRGLFKLSDDDYEKFVAIDNSTSQKFLL